MLEKIKGIGPKTIQVLNKLGIYNIDDLVHYYPFRYDVLKKSNVSELVQNDKIIIDGIVESIPNIFYFNRKMNKMTFRINSDNNVFLITIFNRAFLKNKLVVGTKITVIGKYDRLHNGIIANDIRFGLLPKIPVIEPIYHSISGISSRKIEGYIKLILDSYKTVNYIPNYLIDKYHFIEKSKCLKEVHQPTTLENLKKASIHLKYEELFLFMLKMHNLKANQNLKKGLSRDVDKETVVAFIEQLPFKLTSDQMNSVDKIYEDLTTPKRMNRLLQGDVGSGKTIVAFISLYINYLGGYQGALMAPTEVLAFQHYQSITKLFPNLRIGYLTGNTKTKERKELLLKLKEGLIDILIGTHSLFSIDVEYFNLGLVITDEQHRFGVNQRSSLKNKGITPDILYLSATPIPRTYALTIYGDMDISSIKTMPNGRKEIITTLKNSDQIKEVLSSMLEQIKLGHQIYVIAPMIEESDSIDTENVEALYEKMNKAFGKICNIGLIHGKMSNNDKEKAMEDFKNHKTSILISTTVIEVGVDVKNATMMVIFDSYRFGLSTLHQLRGRVGRNDLQSYCILISDKEAERLNIMTKTNDGFKISEEDFKLRGSGDLFGVRQSGDMVFNIADLKQDFNILLKAKEDSLEFIRGSEYEKMENKHIRNIVEKSINLD
jgi:ATP-dependent DNA helicase RecG